jgi:hypothetical protein
MTHPECILSSTALYLYGNFFIRERFRHNSHVSNAYDSWESYARAFFIVDSDL